MFAPIRKLIVGIVGIGVLLAHRHLGVDLGGVEPVLVDTIIAIGTSFGIWAVPNEAA
jgi:hypothetical protein